MTTDAQKAFDLVFRFFEGDREKAMAWMTTPNPLLGHASPQQMILAGRSEQVLEFVETALGENEVPK